MNARSLALIALALVLPACLESEEELTIRPDGSVHVVLRAKGHVADLADGYPIPLHGPWQAANDDTLEWLAKLGPDTGGATTRRNAAELPASGAGLVRDREKTLQVAADLARVEDLPLGWAPADEPYADAYQARSARLSIERKGPRTVYVFERTLLQRVFARFDAWTTVQRELHDEKLVDRIEDSEPLNDEESLRVAEAGVRSLRTTAQALAEDTLAAIYLEGDASLSAAGRDRASKAVAEALAEVISFERIGATLRVLLQRNASERDEPQHGARFAGLERDIRATLRATLQAALAREGLPLASQNAALGQLEWLLAASDQTTDLGDESFVVRVRMPGTVVGGNFEAREDGYVVWKIPGTDLRDRTRVLRVVSVVE